MYGSTRKIISGYFDNNNGNLSFYYNDILIPSSDVVRLSDRSWSVAIVNAVDEAEFRIVNEEDAGLQQISTAELRA